MCVYCLICNGKATVRKTSIWISLDLDTILNYGDQLYKQVNKPGLLSVEDLPDTVDVIGQSFSVELLSNESGILTNDDTSTPLSHLCNVCHDIGNAALFFVNNYTVSLIWSKKTVFLFDSHSRDSDSCITLMALPFF